jgi:hypothetical protein
LAKFGLNLRILEAYLYVVVLGYAVPKFKTTASIKAARPLKSLWLNFIFEAASG